jgi:hypothetical protein
MASVEANRRRVAEAVVGLVALAVAIAVGTGSVRLLATQSWSSRSPGDTPPGGIRRSDAIAIATRSALELGIALDETVAPDAEAIPDTWDVDAGNHPWIWRVWFEARNVAPVQSGRAGTLVQLDYFTGEVLLAREVDV